MIRKIRKPFSHVLHFFPRYLLPHSVSLAQPTYRYEDALNSVKSAMEMGVVPGGGSIMVHLLKFETEIRKKLTDANAATQVRAPLHKSVYVCVFVLCMCVCVRVLLLLLLFSVEEKLKRKIFFLQRAVNVNETQKNVGLFVGLNYLTSFFLYVRAFLSWD